MRQNRHKNINNRVSPNFVANGLLEERKDERVIFVFGAGPSMSSGIPGGGFLKKKMENFLKNLKETKKVIDASEQIPKKFKKFKGVKKEDLDLDKTFKNAPLECLITVACKAFSEETIIEWLKKYIPDVYKNKIRYFPPLNNTEN